MEVQAENLLQQLRQGRSAMPLANLIVLRGSETHYRSQIRSLLLEYLFGADAEEREITIFSKDTDLEELAGVINTYPFFSGKSLVIIQDEKLWSGLREEISEKTGADKEGKGKRKNAGQSAGKEERLLAIFSDIPEYCTVLLDAEKLDGKSKLYRGLKKFALICNCDSIRVYDLGPWLDAQTADLGAILDRDARLAITEYLETVQNVPLALLRQELEKLALYAGERKRWTRADVETVFASLPEAGPFALNNAVIDRNLPLALALLAKEQQRGTAILLICGSLTAQLRKMLRFQEFLAECYSQQAIMQQLGLKSAYAYKSLQSRCAKFRSQELRQALLELAELNARLRNGGRGYPLLEEILVKLLAQEC